MIVYRNIVYNHFKLRIFIKIVLQNNIFLATYIFDYYLKKKFKQIYIFLTKSDFEKCFLVWTNNYKITIEKLIVQKLTFDTVLFLQKTSSKNWHVFQKLQFSNMLAIYVFPYKNYLFSSIFLEKVIIRMNIPMIINLWLLVTKIS